MLIKKKKKEVIGINLTFISHLKLNLIQLSLNDKKLLIFIEPTYFKIKNLLI